MDLYCFFLLIFSIKNFCIRTSKRILAVFRGSKTRNDWMKNLKSVVATREVDEIIEFAGKGVKLFAGFAGKFFIHRFDYGSKQLQWLQDVTCNLIHLFHPVSKNFYVMLVQQKEGRYPNTTKLLMY